MFYSSKEPDMANLLIHVCNMKKGKMYFVRYSLYLGILVQYLIYQNETRGAEMYSIMCVYYY